MFPAKLSDLNFPRGIEAKYARNFKSVDQSDGKASVRARVI